MPREPVERSEAEQERIAKLAAASLQTKATGIRATLLDGHEDSVVLAESR